MKKILALLLALTLVCGALAACGSTEPQGGSITPLPSESEPAPTETEPAPTETEPAPTESGEKEVSLGAMHGGVYTNTYAGFTCTLDENWTFATAEQLQELPGNVSELFSNSEFADKLGTQIFDMQAENVTELVTMNVLYQKLDMSTRLAYATLTEEQIIDATLDQKDAMIAAYEQAGMDVSSIEKVTVTFCGKTRTAMLTSATMEGVPYFTLQIFDCHLGEYSVTTTFASYVENNTEKLLAMCSPI